MQNALNLYAAFQGSLAADALAMPVHWYYDTGALFREYGRVDRFVAPLSPHTGSILWRSSYEPVNERGDILREQAKYWGKKGVHYHQFLNAGENTLNFKLAYALYHSILKSGRYDSDAWLELYIKCILTPGWHHDTYLEEYHREFFKNYALGEKPRKCGIADIHIGGLATVPALIAAVAQTRPDIGVAELETLVAAHVALTHTDAEVIDAAKTLTRILCAVSGGHSIRAAIGTEANEWLSVTKAASWLGEEDTHVIGTRFSPACYIKDSMPGSLYLAWKYQDDFNAGLVANTMVGGENCHRGAVVGSILGAAVGESIGNEIAKFGVLNSAGYVELG